MDVSPDKALSFHQWSTAIISAATHDSQSRHLASLALAIAFLRQKSRNGHGVTESELANVWSIIHLAIDSPLLRDCMPGPSRSAQGFLAVPLCSLIRDGNIDVLFRLHVWLSDGQRGASGFAIHSHQPFARSWILAGQGRDFAYEVKPVATQELATHAEYALTWTDSKGKGPDSAYKTHQVYSKIVNTKRWVSAVIANERLHTRNMSYFVPSASFHRSEVPPDMVHATLFLFDSASGFIKDAPILGPADLESSTQVRESGGVHASALSDLVKTIRRFDDCMASVLRHALVAFEEARGLCQSLSSTYDMACYRKALADQLAIATDAFCKDTSVQDYYFLEWLIKLRANLEVTDKRGFFAVDYTKSTDNASAEQVLLKAHETQAIAANQTSDCAAEANVEKQYRELFVETIQPILEHGEKLRSLRQVRHAYVQALAEDEAKSRAFDKLKFVRYGDLLDFGRFPRSSDGLTRTPSRNESPYIIFFSHQWVRKNPWSTSPDDKERALYERTIRATDDFLKAHPSIDRDSVGIWIDFVCIDQDNPTPGISALPMIVAQCDALISLVDEGYHDRAWCSVEVMMVLALRRRCKLHTWYEYKNSPMTARESPNLDVCGLQVGLENLDIELARKHLSHEGDRQKVLFLEGLSRLL
ncbi:hypothetical protein LTR24_007664 [Lithohypha guttulata]|uniref:Heterokaryon incompatibility domain-containing protein n=1 Tax=Lithohypha guttulata TaxID=1690604 RepID=A0ABR0K3Q3_9EURO|nr:hypothetical protein LTR24_007664 [Lithohypha guttulata]